MVKLIETESNGGCQELGMGEGIFSSMGETFQLFKMNKFYRYYIVPVVNNTLLCT